jgi:CRISPR-associated exonuclease Cas4
VTFDQGLRSQVLETLTQLRALLAQTELPPPVADARCRDCSLLDACMPHALKDFAQAARRNHPFTVTDTVTGPTE